MTKWQQQKFTKRLQLFKCSGKFGNQRVLTQISSYEVFLSKLSELDSVNFKNHLVTCWERVGVDFQGSSNRSKKKIISYTISEFPTATENYEKTPPWQKSRNWNSTHLNLSQEKPFPNKRKLTNKIEDLFFKPTKQTDKNQEMTQFKTKNK